MKQRIKTFIDIEHYLKASRFNDMYQAYYDIESDGLVILTEDPDHILLLHQYANVNGSPIPGKLESSFHHIPRNCMIYLQGKAIESFADSLLEILMHRLFKPQLYSA